MITKEKYNLHTDITGNCFIVGDDCKFGMFDKLEKKQVIRVIDKLNKQDKRTKELKKENEKLKQRIEALESGFEKDLKAMDNDCMKCEKRYQELIKELESEKEFWRYNCIHESSRNSILKFELELAQKQGYEWSDAFEEYENSVKENSEWNKKYISEKESGDI